MELFSFEPQILQHKDWSITIRRKAFRRSMTIKISGEGKLVLLTNSTTSLSYIKKFILEKEAWIEKHLQQIPQQKKVKQGEIFFFRGKPLVLKFVITQLKQVFISETNENLLLHLPTSLWSQEVLHSEFPEYLNLIKEFYHREGVKHLSRRVEELAYDTLLRPKKVSFRAQKTRWGSCSSRRHISLNWKLIFADFHVIDYVIIHELAHLIHLNHSAEFWALVESHCPDYRIHDDWINKNHKHIWF